MTLPCNAEGERGRREREGGRGKQERRRKSIIREDRARQEEQIHWLKLVRCGGRRGKEEKRGGDNW